METRRPRVLFLFSNERTTAYRAITEGKNHAAGFWGMIGLPKYGIDADFLELEQFFSKRVTHFLRHNVNVYFIHALLFPWMLKYDIVYTSAAFGTQFLHTFYPFKKPLWIMHDFSIASMIGEGKTLKQRIFRFMVARCGGIVTLGEEEALRLRRTFPHMKERIQCIPFGADLAFFKPNTEPKEELVFGVGRDPDRDWDMLMGVAPRIPAQVIIATFDSRVAHLKPFPTNVKAGQFSVDELIAHYNSAKVFVLPLDTSAGLNDAMGCSALFEGLALGKAVVATDTHTMRSYIVNGENGLLVPEGDPEALLTAVNRILGDTPLRERLQKASRAYAEEHLEINKQTNKLAVFFQQCLSKMKA